MSKILVTRSSMPDFEEYTNEIKDIWDSHWLTNMGTKHQELQKNLEKYLESPHVTLYTNGHLALEGIWELLDFPKGSEVITTPFTFASTTHAIVRNGLIPVFCDINKENYCIDADKIESLITDKTVAICPVHVYGNVCDVEKIETIAKKHNLKVIYDAAHAFGVKYKNKSVTNYGDYVMFSFHATKVFNTIEGGAICYKTDDVQKFNDLKNFGIHDAENVEYIGGNAKMNEFQAAMGLCNLRHLKNSILNRKQIVDEYYRRLDNVPGIKLCKNDSCIESNYAYFPVVFDSYKYNRDEIFEKLKNKDIFARKYFYPLTSSFKCYKDYNFSVNLTPVANDIANKVLTLPLYEGLSLEDVNLICDIILN